MSEGPGFDSFAYRYRVAELMSSPAITIGGEATLRQAATVLTDHRIGALVVIDAAGRVEGIVTERDLVKAAAFGADLGATMVAKAMTPDVVTIGPDAFAYVAIGRMQRHSIRHLPVLASGGLVGMLSARNLLRLRSDTAPAIGDAIAAAETPGQVAKSLAELPGLAARLIEDDCNGHEVAAVISSVYRDATRRAAAHAEATLAGAGLGPAPAAYAYLILGSGGRGESMLRPDQDNAIVHVGTEADDPWFEAFGRAASDFLNAAGIPYCDGGVMASRSQWRRSIGGWRHEVAHWIGRTQEEGLLNVDIFFDLQPIHGDAAIAEALREPALELASRSHMFLRLLADTLEELASPFGPFGRLRRDGAGRLDGKMAGILPAVGAARVMALACKVGETATPARLRAVAAAGAIDREAAEELVRAHGLVLASILARQVADRAAGAAAGNSIDVVDMPPARRRELAEALRVIRRGQLLVQDVLSASRGR